LNQEIDISEFLTVFLWIASANQSGIMMALNRKSSSRSSFANYVTGRSANDPPSPSFDTSLDPSFCVSESAHLTAVHRSSPFAFLGRLTRSKRTVFVTVGVYHL
jgi:hypothetical protein